jgi:hypothetical protein
MSNLQQNSSQRQQTQQIFKSARTNLLLVVILTVVNIAMLIAGSETFMLFSASIPYYAVCFPAIMGSFELFLVGCVVAIVMIVLYFLCWLLSKKRHGWLVVALVMFIIDTIALIGFYILAEEVSGFLDLAIHIYVLVSLFRGISAAKKLKTLPEEENVPLEPGENSAPLYRADEEAKSRILLEHVHGTYRIVYRRVKNTNELVINGYVYDTYEAKIETAHVLQAVVDGHQFEAGFSNTSRSYILVDGSKVAEKIRWF